MRKDAEEEVDWGNAVAAGKILFDEKDVMLHLRKCADNLDACVTLLNEDAVKFQELWKGVTMYSRLLVGFHKLKPKYLHCLESYQVEQFCCRACAPPLEHLDFFFFFG